MATHSSVLAWRIPGTGEACWAAVSGVAQSRTRLTRLSSSSSRSSQSPHLCCAAASAGCLLSTWYSVDVGSSLSVHTPSFHACVHKPFLCVSLHALQGGAPYHFSKASICVLIYDTCVFPSDLLQSVKQALGSSTSVQLTQIRSSLWLSDMPLYIRVISSLPIRSSVGRHLGCFRGPAIMSSAAVNVGAHASFCV